MKITNNIQNGEINKENPKFPNPKGLLGRPDPPARPKSRPALTPARAFVCQAGPTSQREGKQRRRSRGSGELQLIDGGISGEGKGTNRFLSISRIA
jgi:hypothetical protein